MTTFARTAPISTTILVAMGSIESREVLTNRMGCLLRLRPCKRPVAGDPLLLVHIRLDQARIDRECFASNQPGRNALRYHTLEYPAQGIALPETFASCTAEYRVIGNLVFNTELAKPAIGKVHLNLSANPLFRTDCKHIADEEHPQHQHRVDRGPSRVRVVGGQLLVHPT